MKKILTAFFSFLLLQPIAFAKNIKFVQISDTRYSPENTSLKNTISEINKKHNIDFVIFTGDNIKKPDKKYLIGFLKEVKNLKCPFYIIVGEHDLNKHKNLSKEEYFELVKKYNKKHKYKTPSYTFEKNGIIFIVVDGSKDVIPTPNGYYRDTTLSWLKEQLKKANEKNVVILQHYPLIPPAQKENLYTYNPEPYLNIIDQNKNIIAVISGHFGINSEKSVNSTTHITTGAFPQYRIIEIVECETNNPSIWSEIH